MGNTSTRIIGRLQRERIKCQKQLSEAVWSASAAARQSRSRLGKLEGIFTGKRCFVMGNGPSLLKCDLALLADEITIGSNAQYLGDLLQFVFLYGFALLYLGSGLLANA